MRFEEEIAREQQYFIDRYEAAVAVLRRVPGVLSVGVGARERRGELMPELAFRVYVAEKIDAAALPVSSRVPKIVCGLPTDVIVKPDVDGMSSSSSSMAAYVSNWDDTKYRALKGGAQLRTEKFEGDNKRGMGTLGCLAQMADGSIVALTAQHIACSGADSGVGGPCVGLKVGQPRHITCCCCCTFNEIGAVLRMQKTPQLDCATIKLDDDTKGQVLSQGTLNEIVDIGTLTGVAQAVCFSEVRKRGAATRLTRGTVVDVLYEGSQILINPLPGYPKFAYYGDSGSVIVDSANKVVGLLWGADRGTTSRGVANHIGPVLAAMGITIAGDAGTALGIPTTNCGSSAPGPMASSSSTSSSSSVGASVSSSSSRSSSSSSSGSSVGGRSSSSSSSQSSSSSSSSSSLPARIEIVRDHNNRHRVDQTSPSVNFVRPGLWDNAYGPAPNFDVRNGRAEVDNFIGSDTRRFYFRVTDPNNPNPEIQINWRTVGTNADAPAVRSLTLRETAPGSHVYVSRAVMVVIMTEDRDFPTESGLRAVADLRAAGQSDHRTRICAIDGSAVRGDYVPFGGGAPIFTAVPIFRRLPDERRRVPCAVINYNGSATVAHIGQQFTDANLIWNQIGIQIDAGATVVRPIPAGMLNGAGLFPGVADSAEEQVALADLIPVCPDNTLTVVFVPLTGSNAYTTVAQRMMSPLGNRTIIFMSHNVNHDNLTLAHELHHALFNRFDTAVTQPFISFNTQPPNSFGVALPDVRVEHRFQNMHSPNPDNDPTNANILNWARRGRAARFPIGPGITAATVTTGNPFTTAF